MSTCSPLDLSAASLSSGIPVAVRELVRHVLSISGGIFGLNYVIIFCLPQPVMSL